MTREMRERHKRVQSWILKWRPRLLLNEWFVDVSYPEHPTESNRDGFTVLAENNVNVPYLKMHISVYPAFFETPLDVQESAIVHELAHAISQPAWNMLSSLHGGVAYPPHAIQDAMETLTQRITNIALGRASP